MMIRLENQDSRLNPQRHHGTNVGLEYPFTAVQWKELERQAMVFKYLMASVPVPPHLLLPLAIDSRFSSNCNYSLRFGRDGDPEPGRCKRTDGKKWRCSKEAMPNERYCDRHSKKRRSRKLVEQDTCKKARNGQKLDSCSNGSASNNSLAPVFLCSNGDEGLLQQKEPRALDWLMIGENRRPEVDNPNVYTGYDATKVNHQHHHHHRFNEYLFSLDSDLVIPRTHKPDTISRGRFIDASSDKQSPPALALDEEMGRIHMGLGVTNFFDAWSDKQSPSVSTLDEEMGRIHMGLGVTNWVGSGSWISSLSTPPGGPLAEVLQHKSTSPSSESPSHSGVGGGSSSLTVEPEITLQWFPN